MISRSLLDTVYHLVIPNMNIHKICCAIVATTMIMVGCTKEEAAQEAAVSPIHELTPAAENTFYYKGQSYAVAASTVDYHNSELTEVSAYSVDTIDGGKPLVMLNRFQIKPDQWNKTVSLASPAEGDSWKLDMTLKGVEVSGSGRNEGGILYFASTVDSVDYGSISIFKRGTLSVIGGNDGTPINILLTAVLVNDQEVKMNIKTASYTLN